MGTATMKMAALVLKHDQSALAKLAVALPAANEEFDWQAEQANDPGYEAWIEEQAMTEGFRHARLPGE